MWVTVVSSRDVGHAVLFQKDSTSLGHSSFGNCNQPQSYLAGIKAIFMGTPEQNPQRCPTEPRPSVLVTLSVAVMK